jgi:prepilin-type N-terminal cleavage/methylation domain-containing protein
MRGRHGFTLVELLIALVLFLIVSAATFQLLQNTQRVARAQAERTDMQSNMRAGALILPAELRSVGYDRDVTNTGNPAGTVMADILGMAADSIAFRAVRSSGIVCNVAANTYVIDNGGAGFYTGYRAPVPGRDTLMVYGELDPGTSSDDAWFRKRITGTGAGNCTATYGARAGTALTTDDAVPGDSVVIGAPFHTFEVMSYKLLQGADNRWYLNAGEQLPADARPACPPGFPARVLRRERCGHGSAE